MRWALKRALRIFIIIIVCLALTGCGGDGGSIYSNYREVEHLRLIRTLGLDRTGETTALTISSGRAAGSGQGALMSLRGESVAAAMQAMDNYASGKQLFYAHARHLIIGEDTARKGLGEFLGYIQRSTVLRMSIELYVVRGSSAKELMTGPGAPDYEISEAMSAVSGEIRRSGTSHAFTCLETARSLSETGAALICALRAAPTEDIVFSADAAVTPVPDGFGILVGEKLVGFIESDDAVAACILTGNGGLTTLTLPDGEGGRVSLTIEDTSAEFEPVYGENGALSEIKCLVSLDSVITELSRPRTELGEEYMSAVGDALARDMLERTVSVLSLEKGLGADFLGLGRMLRDKDAAAFDAMPVPWPECLGTAQITVAVDARAGRSNDLDGSTGTEGRLTAYAQS